SDRARPWLEYARAIESTVIPSRNHTEKRSTPDVTVSDTTSEGSASPASTLRLLLSSASLTTAAPRPCNASRTAVSTLGRLVSDASTRVPITMSETPQWLPRSVAACTIPTLDPTITASERRRTTPSILVALRAGPPVRMASTSSSTAATRKCRALPHGTIRGSRAGLIDSSATYGPKTTTRRIAATIASSAPSTSAVAIPATSNAAVPLKTSPWRWTATCPATTALSPSNAARLNTFEPTTTPTPRRRWLAATAAIAVAISGASAPSAVRIPCSPSEAPKCSLTLSSRRPKARLADRQAARLAQKTPIATPTDTGGC